MSDRQCLRASHLAKVLSFLIITHDENKVGTHQMWIKADTSANHAAPRHFRILQVDLRMYYIHRPTQFACFYSLDEGDRELAELSHPVTASIASYRMSSVTVGQITTVHQLYASMIKRWSHSIGWRVPYSKVKEWQKYQHLGI